MNLRDIIPGYADYLKYERVLAIQKMLEQVDETPLAPETLKLLARWIA